MLQWNDMPFPAVPNYSKTTIDRAGKVLAKKSPSAIELVWATKVLEEWRVCHAYPLNTFRMTLRKKLRVFPNSPIMAQRLKRAPTIILKLKREPHMALSQMQDIGGVRAILDSIKSVRKLEALYRKSKFTHTIKSGKDYLREPKTNGYRGVHLVFKYRNSRAPSYDDLLIELQIRTKLQHIWATTVETMGTYLGQALKSSEGDARWLDFFTAVSAAFAKMEKTAPVPGYESYSLSQIRKIVVQKEKDLNAITKMSSIATAAEVIHKKHSSGWLYHLIILRSLERKVEIRSYSKDKLKEAVREYTKAEKRAAQGEKIDVVLVSAGPLKSLKRAYPNYFLDTKDFIREIRAKIINKVK